MRMRLNDIKGYLRIEKKSHRKQWSVLQHFLFQLPSISQDYDMYLKQNMNKKFTMS